jgi:copper chaperone
MASAVIKVTGMTCSHCVHAVQTEIGQLPGVSSVDVDLARGTVTVTGEPPPALEALTAAVAAAGYEMAG